MIIHIAPTPIHSESNYIFSNVIPRSRKPLPQLGHYDRPKAVALERIGLETKWAHDTRLMLEEMRAKAETLPKSK